jgi:hypothetical protein
MPNAPELPPADPEDASLYYRDPNLLLAQRVLDVLDPYREQIEAAMPVGVGLAVHAVVHQVVKANERVLHPNVFVEPGEQAGATYFYGRFDGSAPE